MQLNSNYALILFDGYCNFCNSSVNFIISRDKEDSFRFVPLQSEAGRFYCSKLAVNALDNDTFILIENGKTYLRSSAALRITRKLKGLWPLLYSFYIVPTLIRDAAYSYLARNRYKWFGKRESCMLPTQELRGKFISDITD